jgi:hypothetical protein
MSTAVVVATIVNTNLSKTGFRQHVVEQLRVNDRGLRDRLADADGDANVVTAVLNVDELLAYLIRRFPKAVDAAFSTRETPASAATAGALETNFETNIEAGVDTAKMSEGEFMNYVFNQLESGEMEQTVHFPAEHWDDDEEIGEDFSRYPFYY